MTIIQVTDQAELDAALALDQRYLDIEIRSPRGVWLELRSRPKYDSSTVTATGSSTVTAYDSSTVRATPKVAVHLHSANVRIEGGVVIDVSKPPTDAAEWCEYHGVVVEEMLVDGEARQVATLYKAVSGAYLSGYGQDYSPGTTPECGDWVDNHQCGNGFHFCPSPTQSLSYHSEATKFLAVGIALEDLRPINDSGTAKCKARRVVRACVEVDQDGKPIAESATMAEAVSL